MTRSQRRYLRPDEVAELAALLTEAPRRVGLVEKVLQAAAEGRGMALDLQALDPAAAVSARKPT